jgi:hypothetical protein
MSDKNLNSSDVLYLDLTKHEIHDPFKSPDCDFCGGNDGTVTFYVGQHPDDKSIGNVCIPCVWKALVNVLGSTKWKDCKKKLGQAIRCKEHCKPCRISE